MKMDKMRAFVLVMAFALVSCVGGVRDSQVALGGIGGTGINSWEGGIGGTGVVGTITGFGSIIVNGLHVHYTGDQTVEVPHGTMTGADFAIGQVVAVQAEFIDGRLEAKRLVRQIPLAGLVESVDPQARTLMVMGETVHVMQGARGLAEDMATIKVGSRIVVDGLRGADGVFASRIEPSRDGEGGVISGTVTAVAEGAIEVDGRHRIRHQNTERVRFAIGDYVSFSA